jgi:hypothetical protein
MVTDPFGSVAQLHGLREQLTAGRAPSSLGNYLQALSGDLSEQSSAPDIGPGWMQRAQLTPAERWIIMRESSGRPDAKNPTSSAFGIWQGLNSTRQQYLGADADTTDPYKQLSAMRRYIGDRYGTAEKAVEFHKRKGWY